MTKEELYQIMQNVDGILSRDLPRNFLEKSGYFAKLSENPVDIICYSALAILFLSLMIKLFADIVNKGYSFSLIMDMIPKMLIFAAIINPVTYKALMSIFVGISTLFYENLAIKPFVEIRIQLSQLYQSLYENGVGETQKIFFTFVNAPLWMVFAHTCFLLFILSVYQITIFPQLFFVFIIAIAPIMIALEPVFQGMLKKLCIMIFGVVILFSVVLFAVGTILPTPLLLISELVKKESLVLLAVVTFSCSLIMAYSLPLFAYISGFKAVSEFRILFPITWIEWLCTKPLSLILRKENN